MVISSKHTSIASVERRPAVELFQGNFATFRSGNYDVAPDGQSFAMLLASEDANQEPEACVILNWFDQLEGAMASAGGR